MPPSPLCSSKKPLGQKIPKKGICWLLFYATFGAILAKKCTGNSRKNVNLLPGTHVMGNYGSLAYLAYPDTGSDALKTPLTSLPSEIRPPIACGQRGSNHKPSDFKSNTIPVAQRRTWGGNSTPNKGGMQLQKINVFIK